LNYRQKRRSPRLGGPRDNTINFPVWNPNTAASEVHAVELIEGRARGSVHGREKRLSVFVWSVLDRQQGRAERMRRAAELESRLVQWGKEYGGGRYGHGSEPNSPLASLMKWHGRPPTGLGFVSHNSMADQVNEAVVALAAQSTGWVAANVIRMEYWFPGQPVESKQQKLRKIGVNLGRVQYYQKLREARIHVAGWLRLPMAPEAAEKGSQRTE